MFCRYCGNSMEEHAVFCGKCGGNNKAPVKSVSAPLPSFLQEAKHSIVLLSLAVLYFIWERFFPPKSELWGAPSMLAYSDELNYITLYIRGFFWAVLCYSAANRSGRITVLVILPYLCFHLFWPDIYPEQSFDLVFETSYLAFEYFAGIVLPFLLWGLVRGVYHLTKRIRCRLISNILYAAITVTLIFLFHLHIGHLLESETGYDSYFYRYLWTSQIIVFNAVIVGLVVGLGYRKFEKSKSTNKWR